jgi:hypothetical protein
MAEFRTYKTVVEIIRDQPGVFRLVHPVIFYSDILQRDIVVPHSYYTDFASIPQFLKDRIDVNGRHREAAIVHDFLCTHGEDLGVTQKQADDVFEEAMIVLEVPKLERWLMAQAVRGFQKLNHWRKGVKYG